MDAAEQTIPDPQPPGGVNVCAELRLARLRQGLPWDDLAGRPAGGLRRRSRLRVRGRRRPWAAAAAGLAVAGGTLIGAGVSTQDHPPGLAHNLGTIPPAPAAPVQKTAPVHAPAPLHATATPTQTAPASITAATTAPPVSLPASPPVTLRIPAIGVSAPVIPLGRNPDGTLQVPPLNQTGVEEAGWYHLGPTPGQVGPAVIAGHVDSYQASVVFYKLAALRPGDTVRVTLQDHTVATFRVDAIDQFPKGSFPTRTVYGDVDYAGLRLITCGGAFDPTTRHYLSNIVAFASLVPPRAHRTPTPAPPPPRPQHELRPQRDLARGYR